jgi:NADH-quinone oxidoreductase subunit N
MIIGAFAVVSVVARRGDERHSLDDYRGMARREPVLAGLLTLFLLAQAGVPLTGGFVAKLGVFSAAVDAGQYALALVGMLTAVISAFVYLRIVLAMYAPDAEAPAGRAEGGAVSAQQEDQAPLRVDAATRIALFLSSVAVVVLGVVPGFALDFARDATLLLAR